MLFRSNDTATTEIYTQFDTLSLHDALPLFLMAIMAPRPAGAHAAPWELCRKPLLPDNPAPETREPGQRS